VLSYGGGHGGQRSGRGGGKAPAKMAGNEG